MKWIPIFSKDSQDYVTVSKRLNEIINNWKLKENQGNDISLFNGKVGGVLLYAYYGLFKKKNTQIKYSVDILSDIFDKIGRLNFTFLPFCSGLSGIGWVIEHLVSNNIIDTDSNEAMVNIEESFMKQMLADIRGGNYDFFYKSMGYGIYFLEKNNKKLTQAILMTLIDEMIKISIDDKNGIKWLDKLNFNIENKEDDIYNFGMAHGISSIISFLCKVYQLNIYDNRKLASIIDKAVKYLLSCQLDVKSYGCYFPSSIDKGKLITGSNLGWCHGDQGVAISLLQAGTARNNNDWKNMAIKIMLNAGNKRDLQESNIMDAGLCHGSAGIAHLFNRFYQYTGIVEFKNAAIFWYKETISMAKHPDGIAGYKAYNRGEKKDEDYDYNLGILGGVSGIGLSLLSAISYIEPKWDRCLLIS